MTRRSSIRVVHWLALSALIVALQGAAHAAPAADVRYSGIPMGMTADGYPALGSPTAPVTMEEWTDYACPYCARHFRETLPRLVDEYVRPGNLRIVVRDFPLDGLHPTSPRAHAAARCVAAQGAAKYWSMHDALFSRQREWTQLPDPGAFLEEVASGLGVDVAKYRKCLAQGDAAKRIAASVAAGAALGYDGTPSFRFLSSKGTKPTTLAGALSADSFAEIIDALVAGREPPVDPAVQGRPPLWARPEGLAPDPARAGYTVAGNPYKGDPAAKIRVIEFTDFQCSACRRHNSDVQPALDSAWVKTGRVLWVSKHLPQRSHPQALSAAVAAECAGEQGRFWDMHDLLFARQAQWSGPAVDQAMRDLAAQLGLAQPAFDTCYNGRRALEHVVRDLYDAQGIIERAPTFIVMTGGESGTLTGPLSQDAFNQLLEKTAASLAPSPAAANSPPATPH